MLKRRKQTVVCIFPIKIQKLSMKADKNFLEDNGTGNDQPEHIARKSQREIAAPDRLGVISSGWRNFASLAISDEDEPTSMNEAITSKNSKYWKEATENKNLSQLPLS